MARMNWFKLISIGQQIAPHLGGVLDDDAPLRDRADDVLAILAVLADETDTEMDDAIVDRVRELLDQDETWVTIRKVIDLFRPDNDEPMTFGALADDKEFDPATVILIIEVVGMLIKLFRDRRDG